MGKEEFLLRKTRELFVLPQLARDLSTYVEAMERANKPVRLVMVTYNRVGEGLWEPRTTKGNLTLDIHSGLLMTSITTDEMMPLGGDEEASFPSLLSTEQVADFYSQVRAEFSRQVLQLDRPTFFLVYGGEGEKFKLAMDLISKLGSLAKMAGKGDLARFYLLTCNCGLAEKARLTEPLYATDLLKSLVYNPEGYCGGLGDLQTIAEAVLDVK